MSKMNGWNKQLNVDNVRRNMLTQVAYFLMNEKNKLFADSHDGFPEAFKSFTREYSAIMSDQIDIKISEIRKEIEQLNERIEKDME